MLYQKIEFVPGNSKSIIDAHQSANKSLEILKAYLGEIELVSAKPFESPYPKSRVYFRNGIVDIISEKECVTLSLHQIREK